MNKAGKILFSLIILAVGIALTTTGCRKDRLLTSGGAIRYSIDTLSFDTVFTTQGSFTRGIKIFNAEDRPIRISSVRLAKGEASFFSLNVDGRPGKEARDIEVAAKDSIYVFATVTIDPTNENTPFLVTDELITTLNGQDYRLPLEAFGQNAYYIVDSTLQTATWLTDKPYVIIHNAAVDAGATLTIPAGARIYMHADSRLFVLGTLLAEGTKEDSIVFQGDRLDRDYFTYYGADGAPGEWGGLYFTSQSSGSVLRHVILKNCGASTRLGNASVLAAAIQVDPDSTGSSAPQLFMDRVVIQNSIGYGLLTFGSHVRANNCLITDCGANAVAIFQGGRDTFNNCTFAVYGSRKLSHTEKYPAVLVQNFLQIGEDAFVPGALEAVFRNCVIFGGLDDELAVGNLQGIPFQLLLDHCNIRRSTPLPAYVTSAMIATQLNAEPAFMDVGKMDYHLTGSSALINEGVPLPGTIEVDLDDKPRTGNPDIGCYEY